MSIAASEGVRCALLGAAVFLLTLTAFALFVAGRVDASANASASQLERAMATWLFERSLRRAPESHAPPLPPSREGIAQYDQLCRACHGIPGGPLGPLGHGLNPPPPDLSRPQSQARTDAQLYFVISRGVRMSGMPAFTPTLTEQEMWQQVAFVRYLPRLSPEERQMLSGNGELPGGGH